MTRELVIQPFVGDVLILIGIVLILRNPNSLLGLLGALVGLGSWEKLADLSYRQVANAVSLKLTTMLATRVRPSGLRGPR